MSISTTTNVDGLPLGTSVAVTFASNGTALALWYDGTNIKGAYASSPYTSWTNVTVSAAGGIVASARLDTSNTVNTIFYVSGGLDYAPITLSGTTYSVGSLDSIATVASGGNNLMGAIVEKDPQNRYWAVVTDRVGSVITAYETTTPGTAGWTSNHTSSWSSDLLNNYPAGGITGNFLLYLYPTATSTFVYDRVDVHGASIGTWTSGTSFTPGGSSVTYDSFMSFRGNSTAGVEANDSSTGIWARVYNPGSDVWASAVQLSSGASDARPTVISGSDGNFYVVWQSHVGTNNTAIVYKKYNVGTTTWDTSATTLVASGANNINPVGGSGNNTLGVLYQTGTATPWTINFASFSFLTNTTYSFTDSLTATDSLLQTDSAVPVDALTVSDIGALQSWPVDALTATDSAFYAQVAIPVDALTVSDTLLNVDAASVVDSLSIADSFVPSDAFVSADNLTATDSSSYVDASTLTESLAASDSLLQVDSASVTDGLSVSDSMLQTDGALATDNLSINEFGKLQSWPVDALTITDSLLQTDSTTIADSLTIADSFAQQGASSFSDNLSAQDSTLATDSAQAADSNTITDAAIYAAVLASTEPLIVTDSDLLSDIYIPIDALSISSSLNNGPTNNLMAFEDDLSILDSFLQVDSGAFSEITPCSDQLMQSQTTMATDSLVMSDTASYAQLLAMTEPLMVGDSSLLSDAYLPIDGLTASDSFAGGMSNAFSDNLSIADLFLQVGSANQTEPLSALDLFLVQHGVSLVDLLSSGDNFLSSTGLLSVELLSGNDAFLSADLANLLEVYPISDSFSGSSVTTNLMAFVDSLIASDRFVGSDVLIALEQLSITDSSSMSQIAPLVKTIVTGLARDGYVIARGKSGIIVAQSRDGVASGRGR